MSWLTWFKHKDNLIARACKRKALQLPCYFFFSFLSVFLDELVKVVYEVFFYCFFRHVWLISDLLKWYVVCFHSMCFSHTKDLSKHAEFCTLTLQTLKTYFYYHSAYGYQTWQGGDLPWVPHIHKVTCFLVTRSFQMTWQTKITITPLP